MHIGSGWCKGLKITTPEGLGTRPTRTRVREAVLSMLQPWSQEGVILDLYAGSGAVGIELVSRGAKGVFFVEQSGKALTALRGNIAGLKGRALKAGVVIDPLEVIGDDATLCLAKFHADQFDVVWADPPYADAEAFIENSFVDISRVLVSDGIFALESGVANGSCLNNFDDKLSLKLLKQKAYGATLITIWQKI
ncbi:MAG: RsmD family RNA methyltransferase [Proteobacteria bacterium]|nr:RsmD family RNA methyltransferase [Pseudomonadota bacterium]